MLSARHWIDKLNLEQHIEGGWYSEVYRSSLQFSAEQLPPPFPGPRNACTHIYFLLEKTGFSALHRIASDELWHFYDGDPLIVYEIDDQGSLKEHLLGKDIGNGALPFAWIAAGSWFGARVAPGSSFSLAGCTVAPGFDFSDFELADRSALSALYPKHAALISQLTR